VAAGAEKGIESLGLGRWQMNADHGAVPLQQRGGSMQLEDGTAAMGSCIRSSARSTAHRVNPRRMGKLRSSFVTWNTLTEECVAHLNPIQAVGPIQPLGNEGKSLEFSALRRT